MILQGFVRAEGVDYSAADAAIATDEAAGADTAQDGPGESVGDVGSAALARDTETLNIISAADQAGANDLVADWGAPGSESFATNWAHAKHAYETLASPALDRVLDDYGLGDDPLILRVAAQIGRQLAAGGDSQGLSNVAATPENIGKTESIRSEMDQLMALMNTDPDKYRSPQVQRRTTSAFIAACSVGGSG